MENLLLLFLVVAAGSGAPPVTLASSPEAAAYRAYQTRAAAEITEVHGQAAPAPLLDGVVVHIEDVTYELVSEARVGAARVSMVVLESIQFRHPWERKGRLHTRTSRHRVIMELRGQRWVVAGVSKEPVS